MFRVNFIFSSSFTLVRGSDPDWWHLSDSWQGDVSEEGGETGDLIGSTGDDKLEDGTAAADDDEVLEDSNGGTGMMAWSDNNAF